MLNNVTCNVFDSGKFSSSSNITNLYNNLCAVLQYRIKLVSKQNTRFRRKYDKSSFDGGYGKVMP